MIFGIILCCILGHRNRQLTEEFSTSRSFPGTENDDEPQQPVAPPKLTAGGRKKFDDEDVEDEVKVRSLSPSLSLSWFSCADIVFCFG